MTPMKKIEGKNNNKKNEKWQSAAVNIEKYLDLNIEIVIAKKHTAIKSLTCDNNKTGNRKPVEIINKYKDFLSFENK